MYQPFFSHVWCGVKASARKKENRSMNIVTRPQRSDIGYTQFDRADFCVTILNCAKLSKGISIVLPIYTFINGYIEVIDAVLHATNSTPFFWEPGSSHVHTLWSLAQCIWTTYENMISLGFRPITWPEVISTSDFQVTNRNNAHNVQTNGRLITSL